MSTHATAQRLGTRSHQCDATSTSSDRGVRAWALLDGIGSTSTVRAWTQDKARLLARLGAHTGNPAAALAAVRAVVDHQDPEQRLDPDSEEEPSAVAVLAVQGRDGILRVGWCGDARAYWKTPGQPPVRLTTDHNLAEEARTAGTYAPWWYRNIVTSHLGRHPDDLVFGPLGAAEPVSGAGRLLLCSDGVYSPFEDNDSEGEMDALLTGGTARTAASRLVAAAVAFPAKRRDNATALVTDF